MFNKKHGDFYYPTSRTQWFFARLYSGSRLFWDSFKEAFTLNMLMTLVMLPVYLLSAVPVYFLWNDLVPALTSSLHTITYTQTCELMILCAFLIRSSK